MNILKVYATTTNWEGEDIFLGEFNSLDDAYQALSGKNYQEYLIIEVTDCTQRIIEKGPVQ